MRLIESCVQNPVKVAVGVLIVLLFGLVALLGMPMQLTPEVEIPTITVTTDWPGAGAYEVEKAITQEQEDQLKSVEGMTKMTSETVDAQARITMEFVVGTDLSEALLKVNARLQQVREYPEDADEPTISPANLGYRSVCWFAVSPQLPSRQELEAFAASHPKLAQLVEPLLRAHKWDLLLNRLLTLSEQHPEVGALLPSQVDITKMRRFFEDYVEARLERVPGVADAFVYGGREVEVQVVVDPQRLAARQLTIGDVRRALRGRNHDTSGGDIWEQKRSYTVRTLGQFDSLEQVAGAILAVRNEVPVYVRDVADVRFDHKNPIDVCRRGGADTIGIGCRAETGGNVLEIVAGLRAAAAELNDGILSQRGLQLNEAWNTADYIESSIGLINRNIVIGSLLTVGVLLCFLRSGRSTLVIALAVPTSVVGTFLVLRVLGRSLNVISLAGLAFAVGMLVDNSVVVLENIYRHYQRGKSPFAASVRGTKEVWGAILASTLTTLAVFIPVLFVQEQAGQLFRDIALAISSAVALSLVVAVSVIPTAAANIFPEQSNRSSSVDRLGAATRAWNRPARAFTNGVVTVNAWLQQSVPLRLAVVVIFVCASVVLSYATFPHVDYLPDGNDNHVDGILQPPPGYNVNQLRSVLQQIEDQLKPYWEVDPNSHEAKTLTYPPIRDGHFRADPRRIQVCVRAADPSRIRELVPLVRAACETIPGMEVSAQQLSLFPSAGRTIEIEVTGPELSDLVALAGRIRDDVKRAIPQAQAVPVPSLEVSDPEVHVVPKWDQAATLGIDAADLGYLVSALVDGAYATDYFLDGDKIDLRIVGQGRFVSQTQSLDSLPIATPNGELVPLAAIADVKLGTGLNQIIHLERRRAFAIRVTPPEDMPLGEAIERMTTEVVEPLRESGQLGDLYQVSLGGTADRLRETWIALRLNVLLALAITYLLLAGLFESWIYPFVILLTVPLAAVGGFAGLWLVNQFVFQPLDVITMLGFVILIGVSVNNPILIVHQSLNLMRELHSAPREAILESVRSRIRPIFMTTGTTVLGLSPLILFPGAGSELYRGLGSVVLGGLVVSTLFTLVLVPTLFSLMLEAFSTRPKTQ